jgi:hypothetical protein
MAHAHDGPSYTRLPTAHAPGHHPSAEDEYLVAPEGTGHEHSDASVWIIAKFGLWLAISAIVISAGVALLFALFVRQSEERVKEFPLAGQEQRLPAAPRLQQFPENELLDFRQHESAVLNEYGWVNKDAGVVRMPIAEAMRLTVERGLPVRAQQDTTQSQSQRQPEGQAQPQTAPRQVPGLMPADSSAGRTMERRRQ